MREGGSAALKEAGRFFMRQDPVHDTLRRFAERLESLNVAYAIAGGMALVAHGYDRTTLDVNVLVSPQGLERIHQALDGRGYVRPFENSRNLRDVQSGVRIEFLVTGQFPGDGKPKPVEFPDPAQVSERIDGVRYVRLPQLIELKLASGMTHPGRLRDLADVQELIRALGLPRDYASNLNAYVSGTFIELWDTTAGDSTGEI